MAGGGHAWRGACMAGGECMVGVALGHAWWGGGVHGGGACMVGVCIVGGMHGRGVCMVGEPCAAGETATAAGGTHPTGMHSC